LPCVAARQRLAGKDTDGKGFFAVRTEDLHGKAFFLVLKISVATIYL
jgi:hypothetical protein